MKSEKFSVSISNYIESILVIGTLVLLTLLFISKIIESLKWEIVHDEAYLYYVAYLNDHLGYVFYKDVFTNDMPGTLLLHSVIVKLFGYGDLSHRCVDISYLLLMLCVTWFIMRRFGHCVAWASVVLWGLSYLNFGIFSAFQRGFLGLLPISIAFLLLISRINLSISIKAFLIGFLFSLSANFKPHLAIGLPVILFYQWKYFQNIYDNENSVSPSYTSAFSILLFASSGFAIPIIGYLLWLWQQGSLPYFWEILTKFIPLYTDINSNYEVIHGMDRVKYLIESYINLGGHGLWLIPACVGLYIASFKIKLVPADNKIVSLLACMTLMYSIYPVIGGQFWSYYWLPFKYFLVMCSSLCLNRLSSEYNSFFKRIIPPLVLIITLIVVVHPQRGGYEGLIDNYIARWTSDKFIRIYNTRVTEIADFLNSNLKPGDKVQPLEWEHGILDAMFITKAEPATPYLADHYFYTHISNPYTRKLREHFIRKLRKVKPRFIIEVPPDNRQWWSGDDTTKEFKELRSLLSENYKIDVYNKKEAYIIYELN